MSGEVVLLVLLGAALHATWNVLVRAGQNRQRDTLLVVAGAGAISAVAALWLPLPAPACYPFLAASVAIHLGYFVLVAWSYQAGDLSVVYPLTRGLAPAFTTLAAMAFLDERPSAVAWIGIVLISLGALVAVGDAERGGRLQRASMGLALANAAVIVLYTLVDGTGVRVSREPISYTAWMLAFTAGFMVFSALIRERGPVVRHFGRRWPIGMLGGACLLASYALALWAMTRASIALVGALRETSIVFGVVLAGCGLKERITRLRCLSIAAIVAGAICLKLG